MQVGFLLFSKTYDQSVFGYSMSGDVLYIRSIASILNMDLDNDSRRKMVLKHIAICIGMRLPEYAHYMATKAHTAGILKDDEFAVLCRRSTEQVYWLNFGPSSKWQELVAKVFIVCALFLLGRKSKTKSRMKANQLRRYKILFISEKMSLIGKNLRWKSDAWLQKAEHAGLQ